MMDSGLLSLKWNNHGSTFFHVLSSIRRKESYTDVTITCDGKFYPVHKLVLSTCSEYFEEIFERTQCKHPVIVLKDIKHEELEALLNYMYLGEVNVLQAELAGLIKAAECLKIKGLAVPDEAPLLKSESTKENKRSAKDSNSGGPLHKRPRQDDNIRLSPSHITSHSTSHSSQSYKSHQKESSREPRASSSQSSSEGGFTSPSYRSPPPNQTSESTTRERRVTAEADRLNDSYGKKGDSTSNSSHPVLEVLVEDTPTVKKEIEEPKEEEEDILNSDNSLAYDSIGPGMGSDGDGQNVFNQHMSGGPQGIEDLVAQSLPGPSSVQGDSLMGWAGGGGGGGSAGNFSLEGFPLEDSSQGGAGAQGGQQMGFISEQVLARSIQNRHWINPQAQVLNCKIIAGGTKKGGDLLVDSFEYTYTRHRPGSWRCSKGSSMNCNARVNESQGKYRKTSEHNHPPDEGLRTAAVAKAVPAILYRDQQNMRY